MPCLCLCLLDLCEAEARAENARRSTLEPLKEELTVALKEGQAAVQDLAACVARVRPEASGC